MAKFNNDKQYKCPKCGTRNDTGSNRSISYIPAKTQTSQLGQVTEIEPEYLQVNCGQCQYTVEKCQPLDWQVPSQLPA